MHSFGLTHHLGTNTTQKCHKEMETAARDFMKLMRHKVANMNPDHLLNMDQTPILFSYGNKCTWEEKGLKIVHTQSSNSETKSATLAATVTMSGDVLPSLLIFKGEHDGRIEQKELPNLPPVCLLPSKRNHGWMSPC